MRSTKAELAVIEAIASALRSGASYADIRRDVRFNALRDGKAVAITHVTL